MRAIEFVLIDTIVVAVLLIQVLLLLTMVVVELLLIGLIRRLGRGDGAKDENSKGSHNKRSECHSSSPRPSTAAPDKNVRVCAQVPGPRSSRSRRGSAQIRKGPADGGAFPIQMAGGFSPRRRCTRAEMPLRAPFPRCESLPRRRSTRFPSAARSRRAPA